MKYADSGLGECQHTVARPKKFQHGPFSLFFHLLFFPYGMPFATILKVVMNLKQNKTCTSIDIPYDAHGKNTVFPSQRAEI